MEVEFGTPKEMMMKRVSGDGDTIDISKEPVAKSKWLPTGTTCFVSTGLLPPSKTLASMGTHELDEIQGPITYEALPPQEIVFQALKQSETMNAEQLFEV